MQKIIRSELFNYLGKNIKFLDIYQDIFDSIEPDRLLVLSSRKDGMYVSLDKKLRIESIILFPKGEYYSQYRKELPGGISFDFTREDVRKLLGIPDNLDNDLYDDGDVYEVRELDSPSRQSKYIEIIYRKDYTSIDCVKLVWKRKSFLMNIFESFAIVWID
jgi:hypothetical protein